MGICVSCRRRDLQGPDKRAGGAGGGRAPAKGAAAELLPRRVDPAMANSISNIKMTNPIKGIVSKRRKRYIKDGFNLDLAYITDRLIAMGFPAEKLEGVYRNHIDEVYRFLEQMHKDHYKIYNLCLERGYDAGKFHGRVECYPFEDHAPPKMELIQPFCEDVHLWLSADPRNVAAVHCKAGKGRTGTMVCCYLLYSGQKATADEALKFYGTKRTHDEKEPQLIGKTLRSLLPLQQLQALISSQKEQAGVTIPSQRRYVEYYAALVGSGLQYSATKLHIRELVMSPPPALNGGQCTLELTVSQATPPLKAPSGCHEVRKHDSHIRMVLQQCTPLHGDVRVDVYNKPKMMMRKEKLFHFWFNTFFVANGVGAVRVQPPPDSMNLDTFKLTLNKWQLDDAHKDKLHKIYSSDFKVEVILQQQPVSSRFSACGRAPSPPSSSASDTTDPDPDSEHWDSGEHRPAVPARYTRLGSAREANTGRNRVGGATDRDPHSSGEHGPKVPPRYMRLGSGTEADSIGCNSMGATDREDGYWMDSETDPSDGYSRRDSETDRSDGYSRTDSAPEANGTERGYCRMNSAPEASRPDGYNRIDSATTMYLRPPHVPPRYTRLDSVPEIDSTVGYSKMDSAELERDRFLTRCHEHRLLDTLNEVCPHGCIDDTARVESRADELCPHGYRILTKVSFRDVRSDCTERLRVDLELNRTADSGDVEMTSSCNNCIRMDFSHNCAHRTRSDRQKSDSCDPKSHSSPIKTMENAGMLTKDGYMLMDRTPRLQKDSARLADPSHKKPDVSEKCTRLLDPTGRKCRHAGIVSKDGYMLVDATPRQPQKKDGGRTPAEALGLPAVTNMRLDSETREDNYMEFSAADGYMKAIDREPKITNFTDEYAFMGPEMTEEKTSLCHATNCKIIAEISEKNEGTSEACFSDAARSAADLKSGKNKKHSSFKKDDYKNEKGKIPKVSSDHAISDDSKKKSFFNRRDEDGSKPKFVFGDMRASWREFSGKWSENRKKKDRDDS